MIWGQILIGLSLILGLFTRVGAFFGALQMLMFHLAVLQPELSASRKLQELSHFAPPLYAALLRHSQRFWCAFCHLIRGEATYQGLLHKVGPLRPLLVYSAGLAQRRRVSKQARLR